MHLIRSIAFAFASAASVCCFAQPIAWQAWSPDVFKQAGEQHKFVLLDLGTQWCHWCHVMDVQTYADPTVEKLIAEKYIPVRVDADGHPDLSDRYEDYGWPATVVFNADKGEIVKRQGYLEPKEMASMLQAIIDDPTPGPSVRAEKSIEYTSDSQLTPQLRDELLERYTSTYDWQNGAWGHGQKFMDWHCEEWAMREAPGNPADARMARQTLDEQLHLLDPAWGGVYQYSTDGDWQHPHFEKIMQVQAENLLIYSLAWAQWHEPRYRSAAEAIHGYLMHFLLGPDGAFYTSQDADLVDGVHSADYFALSDSARRARGVPRIDTHRYARENGWAIRGLAVLYETTGDKAALEEAIQAAKWVCGQRALPGGGFAHDEADDSGPYLGDTLAMGQADLELYIATADQLWLTRSMQAADFIRAHFQRADIPGVMTADVHVPRAFAPQQEFDENVDTARWANHLSEFSGRESDKQLAQSAMQYLVTPTVALSRRVQVTGVLLADDEFSRSAVHIAIVGPKSDASAAALFRAALAFPTTYKRVEWYDPAGPRLPNMDVRYPTLAKPAAFVCTATSCSRPAFSSDDLLKRLERLKN